MVMRFASISMMCGLVLASSLAAQKQPPRPTAAARQAEKAARQAEKQAARQAQRQATRPVPRPGELAVDKLSAMTPVQRERALGALPPERRQRIEKNLESFEKLPPAQQQRARERLELLNSLPPQRQAAVRRSMREFNLMQPERKQSMNRELRAMAPLSDDERRARMNTPEFRNSFSGPEQDAMSHLIEILPRQ